MWCLFDPLLQLRLLLLLLLHDAIDDDDDGEDDITFSQSFLRMILSGLVALRFGTNQNREVITNIVASPSRLRGVPNAHC